MHSFNQEQKNHEIQKERKERGDMKNMGSRISGGKKEKGY